MLDHVPILLAEDDENDVALMQRAFKRAAVPNPLFVVRNGQEVVDYLAGKGYQFVRVDELLEAK